MISPRASIPTTTFTTTRNTPKPSVVISPSVYTPTSATSNLSVESSTTSIATANWLDRINGTTTPTSVSSSAPPSSEMLSVSASSTRTGGVIDIAGIFYNIENSTSKRAVLDATDAASNNLNPSDRSNLSRTLKRRNFNDGNNNDTGTIARARELRFLRRLLRTCRVFVNESLRRDVCLRSEDIWLYELLLSGGKNDVTKNSISQASQDGERFKNSMLFLQQYFLRSRLA